MATVVSVMDRPTFGANTDVVVVVDPEQAVLLWIPRDLWSSVIEDRINRAFARGGHELLTAALAEHGIDAGNGICVGREAVAAALAGVSVRVPVDEPLEFWYPLAPEAPIEEGRKQIRFEPPSEDLAGERIDWWIGARYRVHGAGSDLERIGRQQTFVAALLREGFDFRRLLDPALPVSISDAEAVDDVSQVRASWQLQTLGELVPETIAGMQVFTREPRLERS